jgi:CDGSH-type Zn-finger protein
VAATRITIRPNGSIKIEGDFEIVDQEGKPYGLSGRTSAALCRCGHSEQKPFCDGTHKKINFQAPSQAFELPPPQPKP